MPEWLEAGLCNLAENEADVLLHFEDGQMRQLTMVRLDEPESTDQQ